MAQLERITPIEQSLTQLRAHIAVLQRTLSQLKGDVKDAAVDLPDPDAPGPLARARDALTGGNWDTLQAVRADLASRRRRRSGVG